MWQVSSYHNGCLGKIYGAKNYKDAKRIGRNLLGMSFSEEFKVELLGETVLGLPQCLDLDSPITSYHISYSETFSK